MIVAGISNRSEAVLLQARMYSPTLGRFLQTDSVGYRDDLNCYAYVGNNPVNLTDPTGMIAASGVASTSSAPAGC
ncbi:MAG: RHS repeat-associated core domain-containing protein [Paraburkholderia sp.]|uniref:RHS repeat-associated core domain-containing protein n=1 Tax=Paraburkholderia sp. TaxID=1926495 RepID=UPI001228D0B8|nr:MAG: RHS repeat-associated core domain-containing protein [Paraburkholderia sp.]